MVRHWSRGLGHNGGRAVAIRVGRRGRRGPVVVAGGGGGDPAILIADGDRGSEGNGRRRRWDVARAVSTKNRLVIGMTRGARFVVRVLLRSPL